MLVTHMEETIMSVAFKKARITPIRTFQQILKSEMNRVGMTLKEVHDQSAIPIPILKDFLNGKKYPEEKSIRKLCAALPRLKHLVINTETPILQIEKSKNELNGKKEIESFKEETKIISKILDDPKALNLKSKHSTFGKALAAEVKKANLSQGDFAELVGVSKSGVYNWFKDLGSPIESTYNAILELFPDLKDQPIPIGMRAGSKRGPKQKKVVSEKTPKEQVKISESEQIVKVESKQENKLDVDKVLTTMIEIVNPQTKMLGTKAAIKFGLLASKIENLSVIIELLEYAEISEIELSDVIQILKDI